MKDDIIGLIIFISVFGLILLCLNSYWKKQPLQDEFALGIRNKSENWWHWYNRYLKSQSWQNKRQMALRSSAYRCTRCGKSLGSRGTQVHHRTYKNVGAERMEQLESMCTSCHKLTHFRKNGKRI